MAIQEIKSKINDNKHEKERKLLNTALRLFTEKGIKKTSIQDIVHDAGIAKGTFYLYFKDKYELQDVLLAKTSHEFFSNACKEANKYHFDRLDDKIIFIIDSIIDALITRPNILKFIQKSSSRSSFSPAGFINGEWKGPLTFKGMTLAPFSFSLGITSKSACVSPVITCWPGQL